MKRLIATLFTCVLITNLVGANSARDVLDAAGVKGGFVVHIGCGGPEASVLTAELHSSDRFLVHGLSRNLSHVAASRKHIQSLGVYGSRKRRPPGRASAAVWRQHDQPYGDRRRITSSRNGNPSDTGAGYLQFPCYCGTTLCRSLIDSSAKRDPRILYPSADMCRSSTR